jgi:hypothetical protein
MDVYKGMKDTVPEQPRATTATRKQFSPPQEPVKCAQCFWELNGKHAADMPDRREVFDQH